MSRTGRGMSSANTCWNPDLRTYEKVNVVSTSYLLQALLGDSGSRGPIWQPGPDKYTRLDRELQTANSQFIEEQQTQQQVADRLTMMFSSRQYMSQMDPAISCVLAISCPCIIPT